MNYNMKELQIGDPGFKFTRIKHGYSPEEVDAVIETQGEKIDELTRQKNDLLNENGRLDQVLSECNIKIHQLTQNAQSIEQERQKEQLRLANIMTTAGRTAEETVNDARRKAEEIIADANLEARQLVQKAILDAKVAHEELASLAEIIQVVRESSNRHYDRLDGVIQSAADLLKSTKERM